MGKWLKKIPVKKLKKNNKQKPCRLKIITMMHAQANNKETALLTFLLSTNSSVSHTARQKIT